MDPESTAGRDQWEAQLADVLVRLEHDPGEPAANREAGRLLMSLDRPADAVPYLRRALEGSPQSAELWYRLGMSAAVTGDLQTLRAAQAQFTLLAPEDAVHFTRRAVLSARAGGFDTALGYTDQALAEPAEPAVHAWAHQVRARCYGELGDLSSQLRELELAVAMGPAQPKDVAETAHLQYRLGRPVTMLPAAEALVRAQPENAEAWYALGTVANRAENWWRAKEAFEHAEALGYSYRAGLERELGAALGHLERYQEGIIALERALLVEQPIAEQAWIHCNLGYFHSQLKHPEQALAHYQTALDLEPDSFRAEQGLGAVQFGLGNTAAAVLHLERATELAPAQEHPWYALGSVLAVTGELDRAEEALRTCITLGHGDGKARARLARVYQRQGKWKAAADEARHALRQPLPRKWRAWVADIANRGGGRRR